MEINFLGDSTIFWLSIYILIGLAFYLVTGSKTIAIIPSWFLNAFLWADPRPANFPYHAHMYIWLSTILLIVPVLILGAWVTKSVLCDKPKEDKNG